MFAPLAFLRGRGPKRTVGWDKNPVLLLDTEERRYPLQFWFDGNSFYNGQKYPPHSDEQHSEPTMYHPPPHYHLSTEEHFYIANGAGTWYFWDQQVRLAKGDRLKVPARAWHWFEGEASLTEPLAIEVYYDASQAILEEAFFRNTLGYIADCYREKLQPSVFQLMIFFIHNDMAPGLRIVPWEALNLWFNIIIMYIIGGIGLLMGYQSSYIEYYREPMKQS